MTAAKVRAGRLVLTPLRVGVLLLVVVLALFWILFSKDRIATTLMSGDTVVVHFDRAYKLRPHVSEVKIAFVPVGKVVSVEREGDGARVELKVDEDVLDTLGEAPSATIRPTTLLGGSYFVDLQPGGDEGSFEAREIPAERTQVPVELDKVARALQPGALDGIQGTVQQFDATLDAEGSAALRRLVSVAPGALDPTGRVLAAAQGERPNRDLRLLVGSLEAAARTLSADPGQLDRIVTNLDATTATFAGNAPALADTLANLPEALRSTRGGLSALDQSLTTLRDMSDETVPVVEELDRSLAALQPVLDEARPLISDTRVLAEDARPLLQTLVPTAQSARDVLGDVRGPVLDRVNGPVNEWLQSDYQGKGPYSMTTSEKPMYEEIVYTFADLTRASSMMDMNGHGVAFQPGAGSGSVGGFPISFEQMFKLLSYTLYSEDPMDTVAPTNDNGGGGDLDALLDDILGGGR